MGVDSGNQLDSRSRTGEVPSLVSCFFPLPLFSLPPANFQTVGGKGLENKCVCVVYARPCVLYTAP